MTEPISLRPSAERGLQVYRDIVERLAGSLEEIVRALSLLGELSLAERALPQRIRATERVSPEAFSLYFDLATAALDDEVEPAFAALRALDQAIAASPLPFVASWGDLSPEAQTRFLRYLNTDPTTQLKLAAPDAASTRAAVAAITGALAAFDTAIPELSGEIRGLLTNVFLVTGTANEGWVFDGATTFFGWGCLFLNAHQHDSRIEAIDGLAHESGHALLFGLSEGEQMVENPVSEVFDSPLRPDPRPLDGIYHAAYVSARMAYVHARVLASGLLDPDEAEAATKRRMASERAFWDGYATLKAHARFTPLGARIIEGARAELEALAA